MTVTPEAGDFGLTQIHGDTGKLIRFGQWLNGDGFADYEHAFIYIGGGKIVEAELPVTRIGDLSEYDDCTIEWSTGIVKPTQMQRYNIVSFAKACVGTPYSIADYFSLAAKRLHIPIPGLTAYVKSSGHMICSQEVAYLLLHGWLSVVR